MSKGQGKSKRSHVQLGRKSSIGEKKHSLVTKRGKKASSRRKR